MAGTAPELTDRLVGEAMGRGDIDALLELFEPDAVLVDPGSGVPVRGHRAIREVLEGLLRAAPRLVETGPPTVLVSGDLALVLSPWALEARGPDGEHVVQSGTATDVMRRQADGTWRYVIDNPGGVETVSRQPTP